MKDDISTESVRKSKDLKIDSAYVPTPPIIGTGKLWIVKRRSNLLFKGQSFMLQREKSGQK